ncbi:TetR/AcrR family transcriptional regulator [Mycetocola zhadangensis]|uniref:TetR/AcrR family transcriptional regulator n=1 Tax=Mycetocola zhadangensis TaxID=1164595 RepID=A0A3L7IWJ1_9MICO|nr:TetR/AcrR family transcriptional regulator [Mycetocola zhadangensis]RLQ82577.1 TetR/AcrR family transcriptional regulator [Mycetocola zhadangensis]GGF00145.1 hypothetical protein GCM10011313_23860 [Mycetocola zhadangensis]
MTDVDPRVTRTRTALIAAALGLLEEMDVADLTVAAVSSRAGVSRVAFYDRFGTMDALLIAAMEGELDRVREAAAALQLGVKRGSDDPPDDLVEVFRVIAQRAALYRAMLQDTGSMAFLHRMREVLRSAVAASMHRLPGSGEWPVDRETYYDFVAGATLSVVIGWLSRSPAPDGTEMAKQLWWLIEHRAEAIAASH